MNVTGVSNKVSFIHLSFFFFFLLSSSSRSGRIVALRMTAETDQDPRYHCTWRAAGLEKPDSIVAAHGLDPASYQRFFDTHVPAGFTPRLVCHCHHQQQQHYQELYQGQCSMHRSKEGEKATSANA